MATKQESPSAESADQKPISAIPTQPPDAKPIPPEPPKKEGPALNVEVVKFAVKYFKFVGVALGIWFVGWLGLSYVWVLCGLVIFIIWKLNKEERQKKRAILQESAKLAAEGAIVPRMEDLPSWVRSATVKVL